MRALVGSVSYLAVFLLVSAFYADQGNATTLNYQNTTEDFWEPLPFATLPTILSTKAVFWQDDSIQGKILTIGGADDPYGVQFTATDAVYEMDVATERWSQLNPGGDNFTARADHLAVVLVKNNTQYVAVYGGVKFIDGYATAFPIQDFALLNLDTFTWQNMGMEVTATAYYFYSFTDLSCCPTCQISDCPSARHVASGLTFDYDLTTMYVYGGLADGVFLEDMWKYNITSDTWTQMTITNNITNPRAHSAVQALSRSSNKRIVVFGGSYLGGSLGVDVVLTGNDLWLLEEVSPDTWAWTNVMPPSDSGPEGRTDPLNVIVNSLFFLWGGGSENTTTIFRGPMWVLDTSDSDASLWAWKSLTLASPGYEPPPLSGPGLVYINSTRTLTSIGGLTSNGTNVPSTDKLYRFHPIGLLPPISFLLPDVPAGYDLNLDGTTTTEFSGTSPGFNVRSRQRSTSVLTSSFGRLVEVTPDGQEVTVFDLSPSNGFLLLYNKYDPNLGHKVSVFTRHAVPGAGTGTSADAISVRFEFYQYATDTNVDVRPPGSTLAPQQFFVGGGNIKFNVRVSNWPFADPQNLLVLTMGLEFPSMVSLTSETTSFGTAYTLVCAEGRTTLNALAESVNDNSIYEAVVADVSLSSPTTASLQFTFHSFTDNVFYDPDLGVTVSPSSGDGSDDTWIIVVAVVVPVVVLAALVVLLVLVIAALLTQKRIRRRLTQVSRLESHL